MATTSNGSDGCDESAWETRIQIPVPVSRMSLTTDHTALALNLLTHPPCPGCITPGCHLVAFEHVVAHQYHSPASQCQQGLS